MFNATFGNISNISWRPVLVVEEAGVRGEEKFIISREKIALFEKNTGSETPTLPLKS